MTNNEEELVRLVSCKSLKLSFEQFKESIVKCLDAYREIYLDQDKELSLMVIASAARNEDGSFNTSMCTMPTKNVNRKEIILPKDSDTGIVSLTINRE